MSTGSEPQGDRGGPSHPEALPLRSISPALTVGDIEASLAWYRDVVGFHVEETWEREGTLRGVSLVAGTAHVFLAQDDWARGRDRLKGEGWRLHLTLAGDVDEVARGIEARGGTLDSPPADVPWGARAFDLVDPDGFKLTISAKG